MSSISVAGDTSGSISITAPLVAGSGVLTLPVATDTLVGKATTDTLTNKSIAATQLTGTIAAARLPTGSVLQVVSTNFTTTFSSAAINAWTDITGMSVTITPVSASNKIFVMFSCMGSNPSSNTYIQLVRGSTAICVGTTAGSRSSTSTGNFYNAAANHMSGQSNNYLDSPSTTSATTYKLQFITDTATTYINRTSADTDALYTGRSASTITVMEIAG